MRALQGELDRVLALLRSKIRQRGYTQLEVQKELGWGRSYISQLLTRQKALRVEQVLLILRVVGVDPGAFFAELFPPAVGEPVDADPPLARFSATSGLPESGPPGSGPPGSGPPGFTGFSSAITAVGSGDEDRGHRELQSLVELRSLVRGLVGLLADQELINLDDLTDAVRDSSAEPPSETPEVV